MLCLGGTQVTDAGLAHLKGLTRLIMVELDNTQVTGAGLVHLTELTGLQELTLKGTKFNDGRVKEIQRMFPRVTIIL